MSRYFQHYKGNVYEVIGEGTHTETEDLLVAYRKVHPDPNPHLWFRPKAMFYGRTDAGEMRFKPITLDELLTQIRGEG